MSERFSIRGIKTGAVLNTGAANYSVVGVKSICECGHDDSLHGCNDDLNFSCEKVEVIDGCRFICECNDFKRKKVEIVLGGIVV